MSRKQSSDQDFQSVARILNLPQSIAAGQPVVHEQLQSAVEGLSWKDSARAGSGANINTASPGATIGGVTMATGDRVLLRGQTVAAENGIYIFNGAAAALTRANDANTAAELESAIITVEEGTDVGTTWRQTNVNFTLGVDAVTWASFGAGAAPASETVAGVVRLATQAETDAGTVTDEAITPATLANSVFAKKKFSATFGDGTATQYAFTHNFNTRDVLATVYRNGAPYDEIGLDIEHTDANSLTVRFAAGLAPATNTMRVVVIA